MTPPGKNCELPGTVLSRYPTSPHVSASATDTRLACATNRAAISSTVMTAHSSLYPEHPYGTQAPHTDRERTEMFSVPAADADRAPRAAPSGALPPACHSTSVVERRSRDAPRGTFRSHRQHLPV